MAAPAQEEEFAGAAAMWQAAFSESHVPCGYESQSGES
jgi:hypothetical protein